MECNYYALRGEVTESVLRRHRCFVLLVVGGDSDLSFCLKKRNNLGLKPRLTAYYSIVVHDLQ